MNWQQLANDVIEGKMLTNDEALAILHTPDEELLPLLHGAYTIRKHYYGNKVKLNMIMNAKSGYCPENCGYCSQSSISTAPIEKYPFITKEEILAGAKQAFDNQIGTFCIVASGRGPTRKDVNVVSEAVKEIKEKYGLKVCACLGLLKEEQAEQLKEAGVDRYNHNLNTSARHHDYITTSHTYEDRVNTVEMAKKHGLSPCSGAIIGMKETKQDVVDIAYALHALDADSIPVNFLNAIDGTKLEGTKELNPRYCLKVLALFRFINPTKEIRISGGREINLGTLQPLGLYAANSIFVGDYLTTAGQEKNKDYQMLEDLGFEIELTAKQRELCEISS
ncbi:biotin synthase BioB [Metasolibacillus sp.]|uniref:biotin synthase BioB n=1 Tax=Metasolibacillus sp. TaxID=2703680 RepID=UPI0025EE3850|nr:biotin synthase BioB [Metasolibacillus sp.]MCT6922731.1 biotin synthase BioB [Metasolibacillus sp.]MCT6938930.1 biotin synthase BioB [Metasolibacillus sp.]